MAGGASASDRAGVSGSVRVSAKLFPPRFFGYTFLGDAKKVFVVISFMLAFCLRKVKIGRPSN